MKKNAPYYLVEFYPTLYQNVITKRLLAHPEYDRFQSLDLHKAFKNVNLTLAHGFEIKNMGIIGVGIKN
jgi:hypothetical protein